MPNRELGEGDTFYFTAEASDDKPESQLEFIWIIEGKELTGKEVKFTTGELPAGIDSKEFVVLLRVKDSGGLYCEKYTTVTVKKKKLLIEITNPPNPREKLDRRKEQAIEFKISSASGQRIYPQNIRLVTAKFNNAEKEIEKGSEENSFVIKLEPGEMIGKLASVEVSVVARVENKVVEQTQSFTLRFKNEKIFFSNPFEGREFFIGEKLGRINFNAVYEDGSTVKGGDFIAVIETRDENKNFKLKWNGKEFTQFFDFAIGENEAPKIKIQGVDAFGNVFSGQEFSINLKKSKNPKFHLEITPKKSEFGYKEKIEIKIKPQSTEKEKLKNVKVRAVSEAAGFDSFLEFDEKENCYKAIIETPPKSSGIQNFDIKIDGEAELEDQPVSYYEQIEAKLSNEVNIEFLDPVEGVIKTDSGKVKELNVKITQPGGTIFEKNRIEAKFYVDGVEQNVTLLFNKEKDFYLMPLTNEIGLGSHVIKLEIEDSIHGSAEKTISVSYPFEHLVFPAALLVVVVIGGIFSIHLVMKKFKEEGERMEKVMFEKARLRRLIKQLKVEYLKRHISEKEYKERVLKAEIELKTIELMELERKPAKKLIPPKKANT